jgi:hypothetical protein
VELMSQFLTYISCHLCSWRHRNYFITAAFIIKCSFYEEKVIRERLQHTRRPRRNILFFSDLLQWLLTRKLFTQNVSSNGRGNARLYENLTCHGNYHVKLKVCITSTRKERRSIKVKCLSNYRNTFLSYPIP